MQSSSQEQPSEAESALSLLPGDPPTNEHPSTVVSPSNVVYPSNVVAMPVEMHDRLDRIMVRAQAA